MNLDFIERTCKIYNIQRKEMVEKDILLHKILDNLSQEKLFVDNFLFKGGTCLIKQYLGYFRFSEDLDFTWRNQNMFKDKSTKDIRRELSSIVNKIGEIFEHLATIMELDYKHAKSNRKYVELGGSNKTCTFKIWYNSKVLMKKTFIKIQINFVEEICSKPIKGELRSLIADKKNILDSKDLSLLFPEEYNNYSKIIRFTVYSANEILSEKVRALLTREGVKTRDFLDIFFIYKKLNKEPKAIEKCIIKKMNFALESYKKYRNNIMTKKKLLKENRLFEWGTEKDLVLSDINEIEFYDFINRTTTYLKMLVEKFPSYEVETKQHIFK